MDYCNTKGIICIPYIPYFPAIQKMSKFKHQSLWRNEACNNVKWKIYYLHLQLPDSWEQLIVQYDIWALAFPWSKVSKCYIIYSRTSIIWTPMCHFNIKDVQISELSDKIHYLTSYLYTILFLHKTINGLRGRLIILYMLICNIISLTSLRITQEFHLLGFAENQRILKFEIVFR